MRNRRGLTVLEALGVAVVLTLAAVVLYPIIKSAAGIGGRTSNPAASLHRVAAEAPSDRLPMLAYIQSLAEGNFFLFRRFHRGALLQSYLEELGVHGRRDLEAYKDPFEGVYLWAMQPNTGSEFLNPQEDPYRMPRSAEESLTLFEEQQFDYFASGSSWGEPLGASQPGIMPQSEMSQSGMGGIPQPGMSPGPFSQQPLGGELGGYTTPGAIPPGG